MNLIAVAPLGLELMVTHDQGMNPLAMIRRPVGAFTNRNIVCIVQDKCPNGTTEVPSKEAHAYSAYQAYLSAAYDRNFLY